MAEKSPAFQMYARDFLTDEKVALMSLAEVGAYTLLLCHAWLEGSIPDDPSAAAKLCRVPAGQMNRAWPKVRECWQPSGDGRLSNPRQEEERQKQEEHREERSRAGRLGNEMRWAEHREAIAKPSLSDRTATDLRIAKHRSSSAIAIASSSASIEGDSLVGSTTAGTVSAWDPDPGWQAFMKQYPGEVIPDRDCRVYLSVILSEADERLLFENLEAWKATRKAKDGFMPNAQRFLFDGHWKVHPRPATGRSKLAQVMERIQ